MASDADLLNQLETHISNVQQDPATPLNVKLFESSKIFLAPNVAPDASTRLVQQLAGLVTTLEQDPTPINDLLLKLLEPYSFSDILSFEFPVDFVAGLDVAAQPFNLLTLSLLGKATATRNDAAILATKPAVVLAIVRLWLCTPETEVADRAQHVLLGLLKADKQTPERSNESRIALTGSDQGLVWRRIFGDRDIYSLFYAACSLDVSHPDLRLSKTQKSLAQARLLSWLPKVASLDWTMITRNHHPDVEASYGLKPTDKGLLHFASCNMVDYKGDVLLHMSLISFFADLLEHVRKTAPNGRGQSVALEFLIATGLHARALDISPNKWAHGDSPKDDLHVLASIPRKALFAHTNGIPAWTSSPLSLIPSSQTNADALNTLATVFHGPSERKAMKFPPDSPLSNDEDPTIENEAAAARALFYLYLSHHPKLFADVVSHAETIALKDKALAAINLISAIITAEWAPLLAEDGSFPTESQLNSMMPQPALATAKTGVLAILSPPCLEYVLPYLLQPAQSFTNLVGGRGDTESTAYIIATTKFDALRALQSRLRELYQRERLPEFEQMLEVIDKRVKEGPWSREGEVGGRIGTLEL
ncbi:MAG: hypothetical protein Q9165_004383 [Trypethelium subeluteriae]